MGNSPIINPLFFFPSDGRILSPAQMEELIKPKGLTITPWTGYVIQEAPPFLPNPGDLVVDFNVPLSAGDWDALKRADVKLAIIKATEGVAVVKSHFGPNRDQAERVGIPWGSFLFFRPEQEGVDQAKKLLEVLGDRRGAQIWVDVERSVFSPDPDMLPHPWNVMAALKYLEKETGQRAGVYTRKTYWGQLDDTRLDPYFADCPLWCAHYNVNIPRPDVPKPWNRETLWQYTDKGAIPDIARKFDFSVATLGQDVPLPTLPTPARVRFDAPVGTPEERAADKIWPGSWTDANPFLSLRDIGYHTGSDLNLNLPGHWDADRLAPVYASADGTITHAGVLGGTWGNVTVIEHPLEDGTKVYTRYAHLNDFSALAGAVVKRGQEIGHVGRPPPAGAYHLHFDVSPTSVMKDRPGDWPGFDKARVQRDYMDPKAFLMLRHETV